MPFGLKNVKANYQRIMNKVFKDHIKRNTKVYVYNMLTKSRSLDDHLVNLENIIVINNNKVKINPIKYVLRVTFGKFLEFMLFEKRIECI